MIWNKWIDVTKAPSVNFSATYDRDRYYVIILTSETSVMKKMSLDPQTSNIPFPTRATQSVEPTRNKIAKPDRGEGNKSKIAGIGKLPFLTQTVKASWYPNKDDTTQ